MQVLPSGVKPDVGVNLNPTHYVPKDDATTYFSDGVRKIDFILVYNEELGKDTIDFQDFGQLEENHPLGAEYDQFSK